MSKQSDKEIKLQREKATKKVTYIGAAIGLLVVAVIAFVIWFVSFIPNSTVYTVGDYEVKRDLYTCVYYYDTMASQKWADYGFDITKDPYEQPFDNYANGKKFDTWGAYFEDLTDNTLKFMVVMNDTAEKGGYTYPEEVESHIATELSGIEKEKGNAKSFKDYMLENFGAPIEKDTFTQYLTLYYRSTDFYKQITENKALFQKYIGVNAVSFEKTYQSHKDEIDVVSFRYCYLPHTAENTAKVNALKNVSSEKEFRSLCNTYAANETYTANDKSLYTNMSLKRINTLTKSKIAAYLSDADSKAGDVFTAVGTTKGDAYTDIVYLVKPRGKDTTAYHESDVQNWEFAAMGVMLEDYYAREYKTELSETGIANFKKSMIIPEG